VFLPWSLEHTHTLEVHIDTKDFYFCTEFSASCVQCRLRCASLCQCGALTICVAQSSSIWWFTPSIIINAFSPSVADDWLMTPTMLWLMALASNDVDCLSWWLSNAFDGFRFPLVLLGVSNRRVSRLCQEGPGGCVWCLGYLQGCPSKVTVSPLSIESSV